MATSEILDIRVLQCWLIGQNVRSVSFTMQESTRRWIPRHDATWER